MNDLPVSIRACSPAGPGVGEYQANVSQISSEFQDWQLVAVLHSTSQDWPNYSVDEAMRHLPPWAMLGMLSRVAFLAALCSTLPSAGTVRAQDNASTIVGVWKVISIETKEVVSGKAVRPLGDVIGTFMFTRGGRFSGMVFSVNRKAPVDANATEAERVALFNSMVAYNGVYQIDGNKLILTIDNSHIQSWNGTQRPLTVEISGTRLMGKSAPLKAATTGLDVFAEVVWEKLE